MRPRAGAGTTTRPRPFLILTRRAPAPLSPISVRARTLPVHVDGWTRTSIVAARNATALGMRRLTSGLTARARAGRAAGDAARRATTDPPRVTANGTEKWPAASVVAVPTSAPETETTTA